MAEKTAAQKLLMKPGMTVALLDAPSGMADYLGMPEDVTLTDDPASADFILAFVASQAEAEARVTALAPAVGDKTVAWIAYPKGSKTAGYDLNRDSVGNFVRSVGLVVCSNFSIDDKWSGLRIRPLKPGEAAC